MPRMIDCAGDLKAFLFGRNTEGTMHIYAKGEHDKSVEDGGSKPALGNEVPDILRKLGMLSSPVARLEKETLVFSKSSRYHEMKGFLSESHITGSGVPRFRKSGSAQKIIDLIENRRVVYTLLLSHNELGDEGCVTLFDFLSSAKGRRYPISEVQIGSNRLGNTSLLAISNYLKNNIHLRCLDLPNNAFIGDEAITSAFVHAINSSRLEILNLASNSSLSDTFISSFLPSLNSCFLRDLNLTATGLTEASVVHIANYVSSDCCYLSAFSGNSNFLGNTGIQAIYGALCSNYRLTTVSVFANHSGINSELDEPTRVETQRIQRCLKVLVTRNKCLNKQTRIDALRLLRYSRPLLLRSAGKEDKSFVTSAPCDQPCSCLPVPRGRADPPSSSSSSSSLLKLPTEIIHHILSFLAPNLSSAQRIRVFQYASSASTLPQLLPCLPGSGSHGPNHTICVPDPSNIEFGDAGKIWKIGGGGVGVGGGCASGKCLGASNSLVCHREQDRATWLFAVRCDAYERD
ncbi:hypothetical protein C0995_012607 [Termitomyces sp. Mi166|nr:hypothetical protein C0995_012607 [Termitomyces sp. Mi166\